VGRAGLARPLALGATGLARPLALGAARGRAVRGWYREQWWLPGWMFAALTVAPALLAVAWLLPGVAMLLAGRLLPAPMLIIFVPLAVALCYFAMRKLPVTWPRFAPGGDTLGAGVRSSSPPSETTPPRPRTEIPVWALLGTVAIAAGFVVWQAIERSQDLLTVRDPGGYLQYAYWIAHQGTARIPVAGYDFGSVSGIPGLRFDSPGFVTNGSVLTPAFMAGLPLVLAAGFWAHGVGGALLMPALLGGCAILSFAGLAGRLVGGRWAPAAALVLAVTLPEQYVSRTTLSEPLVQVLLFGGLCLVLDSLAVASAGRSPASLASPASTSSRPASASSRPASASSSPAGRSSGPTGTSSPPGNAPGPGSPIGPAGPNSTTRDTISFGIPSARRSLFSKPRYPRNPTGSAPRTRPISRISRPWQAMTLAGFGGLALGLTVLANIGSMSLLLPAFPFLALMFVARLPQAAPLAAGLLIGIGCGVAEGSRLARPYLTSIGPQLHDIGLAAAGFGAATVLIAPLAFPGFRRGIKRVVDWRFPVMALSGTTHRVPVIGAILQGLVVVLPVAVLTGLAIRPVIQVTRGGTDPYFIRYVADLQHLAGLPVDGRQQYYEQSLNWVIWYVGLPAVLLACLGVALVGRRCLRALLRWRDGAAAARFWGLPLLIFGWSVGTALWDPAIFPDQPWASRRLVPVVLPGVICLALWVCSRIRLRAFELGAGTMAGVVVSACCVLALGLPAAVTTFDPGYVATSASGSSAAPSAPASPSAGSSPSAGASSPAAATAVPRKLAVRGMALRATYTGEKDAVRHLCAAIGPSASVVIVDTVTAAWFTQVVRGMCDMPTARMDGAPSTAVEQVLTDIERTGRRPILLGSTASSVALVGAVPQQVLNLNTMQDAHVLNGPPAAPWPVTYTVWMASPAGGA
jgi:hypothetical protein